MLNTSPLAAVLHRFWMRLIPREFLGSPQTLRDANRVVAFALAMLIWVPVFATILAIYDAPLAATAVVVTGILCVGTLWMVRRGLPPMVCAHALTGVCWLGFTAIAVVTDGANSPATMWYACIPVLSIWVCGTRCGTMWLTVTLATITFFAVARELGVVFHNELTPAAERFLHFSGQAGIVACVFVLMYVLSNVERNAYNMVHEANCRLEMLAASDGLTGIANRRSFDRALEREWLRHQRMRLPLSLILVDIDYFKQFNDAAGHLAGDDSLKLVAQAVQSQCRRPGDLAARFGGEEFAVILPNTDERGALLIAETIRIHVKALSIPHPGSTLAPQITVSVGVTSGVPATGGTPLDLLRDSDEALYLAKTQGRDRAVCFCSPFSEVLQFVG